MSPQNEQTPRGGLSVALAGCGGRRRDQAPEWEVPAMSSRLRVPSDSGPARHGIYAPHFPASARAP